jgi:outer membrane protein OmpA-like peptidoglycan-associated protein
MNHLKMTSRLLFLTIASCGLAWPAIAQSSPGLKITVNSNQDTIAADDGLTLREAIALANGKLSPDQLSSAEQAQVQPGGDGTTRIEFSLPPDQTLIRLTEVLPAIERPGLTIDGTTQPGYKADPVINELPLANPVVTIVPAEGKEVFRGLTVSADGVTIRGLSLYGFTSRHRSTATTPPADIFISHRLSPPDISKQPTPANFSPFYRDDLPPKDVVIENNYLGIPPMGETAVSQERSAFGVYVFNGTGTQIRRNWIANHDGSGIITAVDASNLKVTENAVIGNGVAGMPDALRLEGKVNQAEITGNLICANDGSGVYLFKPEGAVQIQDNQILHNGRRLRRSAVYLMGSNHQVTGNQIRYQVGPGVVVAASPASRNNRIQGNRFSKLEGLSIDLVTRNDADVLAYQRGDGVNPPRDTGNRHLDTGNAGVNAPQFASREFFALSTQPSASETPGRANPIQIYGKADPGSQIEVYRTTDQENYGALSAPIASTQTDDKGNFSLTLDNLQVGEQISATATDPRNGTSEPARNAVIRSVPPTPTLPLASAPTYGPRCTTVVQQPPPSVDPPPTAPIRIQIPSRIHFALDQSFISPESAKILDRIVAVLKENPMILVTLVGHTDPRASDQYNLELGLRRAISARNYLLQKGIAPERLTIRSQGESQLISPGQTALDFARDRRTEFIYRDARDIEVIVQEDDLQIESGGAR